MNKLILDDPRQPWLPAGALMVLSLLVFSPVIFGGQFFWDDYVLLLNNGPVRAADGLWRIWFTTENPDYFPLTSSMFWIEWRLFGDATPHSLYAFNPYHLVNAVLHGGAAILLWRTLRELHVPGALLAALLFVVHPVNVESVAWIAEGKNTLSVCLMMGSLLAWVHSERSGDRRIYGVAIGLFLLALLAKTAVVMLPVAMVLILWYRRRATLDALLRAVPFFAMSLALGLVTIWFQAYRAIQDIDIRDDHFVSRLEIAGCAVWFYLGHAIAPVWISFAYGQWDVSHSPLAFVPVVLLTGLAIGLWAARKRIGRGFFAALAIYLVMLLPILGFVNVFFMRYSLVSDHWQYPAIPVFCAVVGALVTWAVRRASVTAWNAVMGAACVALGMLAIDSASIAAIYRTPEGVWQDVLRHDPDSWLAHARMGEIILEQARAGRPELAIDAMVHLQKIVDLRPDRIVGYTNLGNAYSQMGMYDEAQQCYQQGLAAPVGGRSERALLHVNIGALIGRRGDAAGAEREFEEAVRVDPETRNGWLRLGMVRAQRGDFAGARSALETSAALDKQFIEPRLQLAQLLIRTGDGAGARRLIEEVRKLDPGNPMAERLDEYLASGAATTPAAGTSAPRP